MARGTKDFHTHWRAAAPCVWTLLCWGLALSAALVVAASRSWHPMCLFNLIVCIFACQAARTLQQRRRQAGFVSRCRVVGRVREKKRRTRGSKAARWGQRLVKLCLLLPGTILCIYTVHVTTVMPARSRGYLWALSRHKRNRTMHALYGNTGRKTKPTAQARIGGAVVRVPGDGWCFFHAVARAQRGANTWSQRRAAELYLQALEWLLQNLAGNPDTVEIVHHKQGRSGHFDIVQRPTAAAAAASSDSASRSRAGGPPPTAPAGLDSASRSPQALPAASSSDSARACSDSASRSRAGGPPPTAPAGPDSASRSPPDDAADVEEVWPEQPTETAEDTASSASSANATDVGVQSVLSWQSSPESTDSDAGPEDVTVEPVKTWTTVEDKELEAIKHLATAFRQQPLLPPPLTDQDPILSAADSGVAYPAMHCAFAGCDSSTPCASHWEHANSWKVIGCKWTAPCTTCCDDPSHCLCAHLRQKHGQHFQKADIPSLYRQALILHEERHVPAVGASVDRRTLRRLCASVQDEHCLALVCACCARVQASGDNSDIGYLAVAKLFGEMTTDSFNANWDFAQYSTTYGKHPSAATRLEEKLWVRTLPQEFFAGGAVLCCPEDLRCSQCMQEDDQLCHACEVPLCRSCMVRMKQQQHAAVPQALCNDNWCGYPLALLYTHRVRWIEAAVASPVWTSVVSYYIEADHGHLMQEELHRSDHRLAIRGNVSSFSLPWEDIFATLHRKLPSTYLWADLPHGPDVVQALVRGSFVEKLRVTESEHS
eukprot:s2018_g4.t1